MITKERLALRVKAVRAIDEALAYAEPDPDERKWLMGAQDVLIQLELADVALATALREVDEDLRRLRRGEL